MLLVADKKQNLPRITTEWTEEAANGAKFMTT